MENNWAHSILDGIYLLAPPETRKHIGPITGGTQGLQADVLLITSDERQYLFLAFYGISGARYGDKQTVYPLFVSATIDYPSKQIEWKTIEDPGRMGFFNLPINEYNETYLGYYEPSDSSREERRDSRLKYNDLISRVLENRWLVTAYPITAEEQATARELKECIHIQYERLLMPYYQHIGRQFMAWMERAAK